MIQDTGCFLFSLLQILIHNQAAVFSLTTLRSSLQKYQVSSSVVWNITRIQEGHGAHGEGENLDPVNHTQDISPIVNLSDVSH